MESKSNSKRVIFKPYPKQEEFIKAVFSFDYNFLTYGGAMGGGKSWVCLAILVMLAKIYPRSKWCVIRESVPTLTKTTLPTFRKIVPPNFLHSFNQNENMATFTNGSQMLFMAEDFQNDKDFDRFKGLEVNGFLLEQIEELQEGLLDICFIRSGRWSIEPSPEYPHPKQPPPIMIANVNPTLLWPKRRVYDPYQKGALPKKWFYLPAKITDNPKLFEDKEYMAQLDNLDSLTRRRMIEGDWTAFAVEKPYLYNFRVDKHVTNEVYEINPHLPILVSFDFNVEPMTTVLGQKTDESTVHVFDEKTINTGSAEEMAELVKSDYPGYEIQITGDATGKNREKARRGNINAYTVIKDVLELYDRDIRVPTKNPAHRDSRILCNSVLQHANVIIHSNCENTIRDCVYSQVDEDGDLVKTKDEGRHHFDNFRYLLHEMFHDFIKNPKKYRGD